MRKACGGILNIGKLRKGGELYYLNSVARGVEDYYTGSGEAPGYWLSKGAEALELSGEVGELQLRALLNGHHPLTAERLLNGKPTKRERVPGFDLTFRAPKSVALVHALGGKEASNEVVSAHDAAVGAALAYLEREASSARRGKGGLRHITSEGFIGAAFRHRTSRAGDPLLHTHVLVANLIKGEDGRWGALDARQLYRHAKTAGYLYQAHLRQELTRRIGVEWAEVRNGSSDIAGVSRTVIRAFSKRRNEIEVAVSKGQLANAKAMQVATLRTRKAKDYKVSPNELLPEWKERAAQLGLTEAAIGSLLGRAQYRTPSTSKQSLIEVDLASPEGLTAQASTFGRREVVQAVCSRLESGASVEEIERMAERFLDSEPVVPLTARTDDLTGRASLRVSDGRIIPAGVEDNRYSTNEMLSVERSVVERAIARRLDGCGVAEESHVAAALSKRPSLFADQQAMVKRLTTSGQGVEVVVGKAGAGKTFALDAARDAWESSGKRVIGCSLSARAAEELQLGSGIQSFTLAGLLQDLDSPLGGGLPAGGVVVVDEAGMVGTRTLDRLFDHAEVAKAKVVLVGDDRQLPEIEAGGAFRGIKNRLPAIELSEVRRQPFGWERDALDLIRAGRSEEAVDSYLAHDRVVLATSSEETRRRLIADWWATQDDPEPAVMLAARRSDVADLNERARALMIAAGRLGDSNLEIDGRRFAIGDRVMALKNTRQLGVKNGTRGTVEGIDEDRRELTMRRDDGVLVAVPRGYLEGGNLTHAYAMTGHKAQGMTTDKAYVLGDQTLYREWTYVAMSRGRNENRLYVVGGIDPDREDVGGEVAGIEDPLKELVAAVGRSRAKDLALDSYSHAQISNLSTAELRQRWETERALVDQMPPSTALASGEVQRERSQLEATQRRHMLVRSEMTARPGETGRGWRQGRAAVRDLRNRLKDLEAEEAAVSAALKGVESLGRKLRAEEERRDRWLLENAPSVRNLDALGRELWWREQQQALAAEVAMPQYLLKAVGERPEKPSEHAAWREAVRAIETYRDRWGVTDTERALGDDVSSIDQSDARRSVEAAAARVHDLEMSIELRERSIE